MGPQFKVSSERWEKQGINLAIPGLVVQHAIHYTTAAPSLLRETNVCIMEANFFQPASTWLPKCLDSEYEPGNHPPCVTPVCDC